MKLQSRNGRQKDSLAQTVDITLQLLQGLGFKPSKVLKGYLKGRNKSSLTRKELSGLNGYLTDMYEEAYADWVMMRIEQDKALVPDTNEGVAALKTKFFRLQTTSYRLLSFDNRVTIKIRKDDMVRKKSYFAVMDYEINKGAAYYMKALKELRAKL